MTFISYIIRQDSFFISEEFVKDRHLKNRKIFFYEQKLHLKDQTTFNSQSKPDQKKKNKFGNCFLDFEKIKTN